MRGMMSGGDDRWELAAAATRARLNVLLTRRAQITRRRMGG